MIHVTPTHVDQEPFQDRWEMSVSAHVLLACLVIHTENANLNVSSTQTVPLTKHVETITAMTHVLVSVVAMLSVRSDSTLHCAHVCQDTSATLSLSVTDLLQWSQWPLTHVTPIHVVRMH